MLLFLACGTQWLYAPSGTPLGINYLSLETIMNAQHIRQHRRKSLLNDVRIMEETALSVFREKE